MGLKGTKIQYEPDSQDENAPYYVNKNAVYCFENGQHPDIKMTEFESDNLKEVHQNPKLFSLIQSQAALTVRIISSCSSRYERPIKIMLVNNGFVVWVDKKEVGPQTKCWCARCRISEKSLKHVEEICDCRKIYKDLAMKSCICNHSQNTDASSVIKSNEECCGIPNNYNMKNEYDICQNADADKKQSDYKLTSIGKGDGFDQNKDRNSNHKICHKPVSNFTPSAWYEMVIFTTIHVMWNEEEANTASVEFCPDNHPGNTIQTQLDGNCKFVYIDDDCCQLHIILHDLDLGQRLKHHYDLFERELSKVPGLLKGNPCDMFLSCIHYLHAKHEKFVFFKTQQIESDTTASSSSNSENSNSGTLLSDSEPSHYSDEDMINRSTGTLTTSANSKSINTSTITSSSNSDKVPTEIVVSDSNACPGMTDAISSFTRSEKTSVITSCKETTTSPTELDIEAGSSEKIPLENASDTIIPKSVDQKTVEDIRSMRNSNSNRGFRSHGCVIWPSRFNYLKVYYELPPCLATGSVILCMTQHHGIIVVLHLHAAIDVLAEPIQENFDYKRGYGGTLSEILIKDKETQGQHLEVPAPAVSRTMKSKGQNNKDGQIVQESSKSLANLLCEKNPSHKGFYTLEELCLDDLPQGHRDPKVLDLIHSMARLTVRIRTVFVSHKRPETHPFTDSSYEEPTNIGTRSIHHSTGCVVGASRGYLKIGKDHRMCHKCMTDGESSGGSCYQIIIMTAVHSVFDIEEAKGTVVDFMYSCKKEGEQGKEGGRQFRRTTLKGCSGHSVVNEDTCLMEFTTHDEALIIQLESDLKSFQKAAMGNLLPDYSEMDNDLSDERTALNSCLSQSNVGVVESPSQSNVKIDSSPQSNAEVDGPSQSNVKIDGLSTISNADMDGPIQSYTKIDGQSQSIAEVSSLAQINTEMESPSQKDTEIDTCPHSQSKAEAEGVAECNPRDESQLVVIISHPHGTAKQHVSFGNILQDAELMTDTTHVDPRNYKTMNRNNPAFKFFHPRERIAIWPWDNFRPMICHQFPPIYYTTPTCKGSSGALVLVKKPDTGGIVVYTHWGQKKGTDYNRSGGGTLFHDTNEQFLPRFSSA